MSIGKIRLDKADQIFSKYIRLRDNYTCIRCYKFYPGGLGLQASHFHGRGKESTRFDPENLDALCAGCHQYWGSTDREAYRAFKLKQLGKAHFDALMLRANTPTKKDRKMQYLIWNEAYKQLLKEKTI
jgi:hypothetical protein